VERCAAFTRYGWSLALPSAYQDAGGWGSADALFQEGLEIRVQCMRKSWFL
jgi:hypothetical protein